RMKVDSESRATTVMMYKGVAEVTKSGQTVKVTANNATRIEKDEAPTQPKPLPDSPTIEGPKDSKRFLFSTVPPEVVFKWSRVPGATRYRISIARDPEFRDIVEETLVSTTSYQNFELAAGTYFWRVYSVEHDTIGVPSKTRRLTVIKDDEPPKLIVNFPPKIVNKSRYTISGVTDPGATVYVDGVKTKVNGSGRFSYDLELRPGINILVIESIDNVGNTSYKSERIFYKNG
ncbi:MAG: hypothetical protein OEX00_05060, partial [Gammaproteobacteria bacterium]|nr:hypothetical protein [Gammaproteobacteria bacterium]